MAGKTAPDGAPKYFNRELSWLEFNARVLGEALDRQVPPLERLKFLGIVASNFDEFFMVRVATLKHQVAGGDRLSCPSGLRPSEQLKKIATRTRALMRKAYGCFYDDLLPALRDEGLQIVRASEYTAAQRAFLQDFFERQVWPVLTPLALTEDAELPLTGNLRLYVAFKLQPLADTSRLQLLPLNEYPAPHIAIVQMPPAIGRFQELPTTEGRCFALLEDIVSINAEKLFSGYRIEDSAFFRVTRDADMGVDEERDEDFIEAMAEVIAEREHSRPVRLQIATESTSLKRRITKLLGLSTADVYDVPGPLDLKALMKLAFLPGYDHLRDPVWKPVLPPELAAEEERPLWDVLKERDVLLHHPYESFDPVVRFIAAAADDAACLAIKITLYRTSGNSPIIAALARAAARGKQVTAVVELKARFDEDQNIGWARRLEQAGVIVIYGIARLKIHSKAALVVRREDHGLRSYVHLATGNYNDSTAKLYTDMGMMSAREELGFEVGLFFNAVTGYTTVPHLQALAMAPRHLRDRTEQLIQREIERSSPHRPGLIMAKMNSLACPRLAKLLYQASQAGVRVWLNVRGICCLRPGVPGLSENIRVVSIIDRYLEHSRIFYFQNGDAEPELFMASADWMVRNLDNRVELMFPVLDRDLRERLVTALEIFFADNQKAHDLQPDGRYQRCKPAKGDEHVRAQETFYRHAKLRAAGQEEASARRFRVRRTPPQTLAE